MQAVELQEFFGPKVIVQMREGLAIVKPTGKEEPYVMFRASGEPVVVQGPNGIGPATKGQYLAEYDKERAYELTLECRILPAEAGRVFLLYEAHGHVVKTSVRPSDIYAVSVIEQKLETRSPLITPGSA